MKFKQKNQKIEKFANFYDVYFPKIFKYVSFKIANKTDTEDIVSDIFTKAMINFHKYRELKGANIGSWIFKIAYNSVIDFYRTYKKNDNLNLSELPEIISDSISFEDLVESRIEFQKIFNILNELSDCQSEIISMRFFGERSNKEISQILGIKEKTVSGELSKGLKRLYNLYTLKINKIKKV